MSIHGVHETMLGGGVTAPDFELEGVYEGEFDTYRLSEYTRDGKWVLLSFYAFDFHPVCTAGLRSLRDAVLSQFEDDFAMVGVSGDGVYSHRQFAEAYDIDVPLLSDTSKEVGDQYGVVHGEYEGMKRVHQRGTFVIDDERTVRLSISVDATTPEESELDPLVEAIRELRG